MNRLIPICRAISLRYLGVGALALILCLGLGAATVRATPPGPASLPPVPLASRAAGGQISPRLLAEFQQAGATAQHAYWVILAEQADTRNDIPLSRWADKGWYVYNALISTALRTQPAVRQQLNTLQTARQVSNVQSFWIINSFVVTGDLASAKALAANPAVANVRELGKYHLFDAPETLSPAAQAVLDQAEQRAALLPAPPAAALLAPLFIQHNISEVHAPQAWALGYDGTGITVGSMDSGVRWTHEAINAHYRGVVAPPDPTHIHDYNWFDGYNVFATPTDNNRPRHATRWAPSSAPRPTLPTAISASPRARSGSRVRICATSACDTTPILNGFQWTLAPTRVRRQRG